MKSKTILLGLNELNFDYIKFYINQGLLPNFKKIFEIQPPIETVSENDYKLLEPWVQWVTIHSGKSYKEHNIFRLGDIVNNPELSQIFEELEVEGLSVGAVSPFNAENRLKKPAFFVPDPWTKTNPSGNWIVKALYHAVHQSVNDNAKSKLNFKSMISLGLGLLLYVPFLRWSHYMKVLFKVKKPGAKAIILDSLLADVHLTLWKKHKPDFSNLFLNSGAHIQHHYLFNSKAYVGNIKNPEWYCPADWDPVLMMLETYDVIIGDLLESGERIIGVTGLHQIPHEEQTFYWRPVIHKEFLIEAGLVGDFDVIPRMSRDFLIEVSSEEDALEIERHLGEFKDSVRQKVVFNVDNRGKSLFVEVVYDDDLVDGMSFDGPNGISIQSLKSKLAFVAIKNGKHDSIGYIFSNMPMDLSKSIKLTQVYDFIKLNALTDAGLT